MMVKSEVNDEKEASAVIAPHEVSGRITIKRSWIAGSVVTLIVVAGGMFLLGMAVGKSTGRSGLASSNSPDNGRFGMTNGQGGFGGPREMGTRGTVTAISSSSITIKTSDDESKTYTISDSTTIRSFGSGAKSIDDITTGMTIAIQTDDDAASTATAIIIFGSNDTNSTSGSSQSY